MRPILIRAALSLLLIPLAVQAQTGRYGPSSPADTTATEMTPPDTTATETTASDTTAFDAAAPDTSYGATAGGPGTTTDPGFTGEVAFCGGWKWPLDDIKKFGDDGFTGWIRVNVHPDKFKTFSWTTLVGGTYFAGQTEPVIVTGGGSSFSAERTTSQFELSLNMGPQLGAATRRSWFRPRLAVTPGLYLFNTTDNVRLLGDTEDFISDGTTLIRFGWKGVAGLDLFFSRKWGISLDFVYDAIWNLEYVDQIDSTGVTTATGTARYAGFLVGVVIPTEAMQGD